MMYTEADANDEDACDNMVWEGAECWEETLSAGVQSETTYGWMHSYKRADAADEDACDALNNN